MRINPKFWKILDKTSLLILAVVSYVFVAEAISDYIRKKSTISYDELPIKEQPTVTFCFGEEEDEIKVS